MPVVICAQQIAFNAFPHVNRASAGSAHIQFLKLNQSLQLQLQLAPGIHSTASGPFCKLRTPLIGARHSCIIRGRPAVTHATA
jgi:hypothetical protein